MLGLFAAVPLLIQSPLEVTPAAVPTLEVRALVLDTIAARSEPTATDPKPVPVDSPLPAEATTLRYGAPGPWWVTLGGGYAYDFHQNHDVQGQVAFSTFLATDLEFAAELGAWYHHQKGPDTGSINPQMYFRWHFWHDEPRAWTLFGEAGIGLLAAFADVPEGGTNFNFTPRLGLGLTHQIGDGPNRLEFGLRWHHISNGRIEGDGNNPSRNGLMIYLGFVFPL